MILIIDCTCQDFPMLMEEFVKPITSIVRNAGYEVQILPLNTEYPPDEIQGIILTGTALMDDQYLETGLPDWVVRWTGPVLGICAGMQLIATSFGGRIIPCKEIGMTDITILKSDPLFSGRDLMNVWELHQSGVWIPESFNTLARSTAGVQVFRLQTRPWYGVLFHPEVRNEWIITNFLEYCNL